MLLVAAGSGGKSAAIIVRQKQAEIIEALPMPVKTLPTKGTPLKVKIQEVVSPKGQSSSSKDSPTVKIDKGGVMRRRKDKVSKMIATSTTTKEVKPGLSVVSIFA